MMQSPYSLSQHAFLCFTAGHYVFLDLRNDEYLCLARGHSATLKGILSGDQRMARRGIDESKTHTVVQVLLKKNLLVEAPKKGKPLTSPYLDTPRTTPLQISDSLQRKILPRDVWRFLAACTAASRDLRWRPLEHTVLQVRNRNFSHTVVAPAGDKQTIIDLYILFQALRPYYPRRYLCIFDSLALLHFLAHYRVFPEWVFGVKLQPFGAHCWVQAGPIVVNDTIDNVRDYTPIMAI